MSPAFRSRQSSSNMSKKTTLLSRPMSSAMPRYFSTSCNMERHNQDTALYRQTDKAKTRPGNKINQNRTHLYFQYLHGLIKRVFGFDEALNAFFSFARHQMMVGLCQWAKQQNSGKAQLLNIIHWRRTNHWPKKKQTICIKPTNWLGTYQTTSGVPLALPCGSEHVKAKACVSLQGNHCLCQLTLDELLMHLTTKTGKNETKWTQFTKLAKAFIEKCGEQQSC